MSGKPSGRWIVSTQKHLVSLREDSPGLEHLDKTITAGKCGRLLARIRQLGIVNKKKLIAVSRSIGIMPSSLDHVVIPALEKACDDLIFVRRDDNGEILAIEEYIASKHDVISATEDVWETLDPSETERVSLSGLEYCEGLPRSEDEYLDYLHAESFSEESIKLAYELQRSFGLVARQDAELGLKEPIVFNEYMWGIQASAIYNALSNLSWEEREQIEELLEFVRANQGSPITHLPTQGKLYQLARKTGIVDVTAIRTSNGEKEEFVTTPRIWGTLSEALDDGDIFDDVKLFLDSIRYGQHFGKLHTGKIHDPELLLSALLKRGEIGPASAIGTDYPLVEAAGIISVEETKSGLYVMKPKKFDVIETVLDILQHGKPLHLDGRYTPSFNDLVHPSGFTSAEEIRSKEAKMPPAMQEVLNSIVTHLRT